MTTKTLSNEFMQNIATEEAWKELSSEFNWNETMLEKYQNKVDWDEISENRYIRWTIPMMQKFQKKINWNKLSANIDEDILTEGMIEAFKNQWNWHELSGNWGVKLTHEIIEKYADKWDWEQLIDKRNNNVFEGRGIDFYERYKDYIPVTKLQNTGLWMGIVCQQKNQLIEEITA